MQCDRVEALIGSLRDGELALAERREVEAHLETCRACRDAAGDIARIGEALRAGGRAQAPRALATRIEAELDRAQALTPVIAPAARPLTSRPWLRQAAALIIVAGLSSLATGWFLGARGDADLAARDLLAAHMRSLIQESPVQVASSDKHNVGPWFAGRVDFAPPVADLSVEGFPLVGGRVDYVGDQRVGAIVYKRRLHVINVFMWPAPGVTQAPQAMSRNGYNIVAWAKNGVAWRAVSDLDAAELLALQGLL
jgi:anti-sigma factor RsiW